MREIAERLGVTPSLRRWEKKPDSVTDIPLAQVGIWLKLENPIYEFSSEKYIPEIERRVAGINWADFDEGISKPEINPIRSVWASPVGAVIIDYLKSCADDDFDLPTDPEEQVHDAMLTPQLQKKMCAYLNEQELRRVGDGIAALGVPDDKLIQKRREFHVCCRSLLNDWFAGTGLPIPQFDSAQKPKSLKRQFEELFDQFYNDSHADPSEVKRVLGDKDRWKNPSYYLHQRRRDRSLTPRELKKHPGFAWIDPKGTSIG